MPRTSASASWPARSAAAVVMILAIEAGSRACSNAGVPPEAARVRASVTAARTSPVARSMRTTLPRSAPSASSAVALRSKSVLSRTPPLRSPARAAASAGAGIQSAAPPGSGWNAPARVEESGEHAPSIGDGDGRACGVSFQHPRDPPPEAGVGGEPRKLAQQLRGRAIVAAFDQRGRLVGGGSRIAVRAREPGQATREVELAAAQGRVHQHARPVERELGSGKIVGGRRPLEHGRDREARARPAPEPARIAVALEQRTAPGPGVLRGGAARPGPGRRRRGRARRGPARARRRPPEATRGPCGRECA